MADSAEQFVAKANARLADLYVTRATAYDGSTRSSDRELKPLERDILVRILGDIFTAVRRQDFDSLYKVHRSFNQEEINILLEVCSIIDPREC